MPNPDPVNIRGIDYPSQAAASRALGVYYTTVWAALERGTLQFVGLGRNYHNKKPIWLDGVKFDTHAALAVHLGIKENCLRSMKTRAKRLAYDFIESRWGYITWTDPTEAKDDTGTSQSNQASARPLPQPAGAEQLSCRAEQRRVRGDDLRSGTTEGQLSDTDSVDLRSSRAPGRGGDNHHLEHRVMSNG